MARTKASVGAKISVGKSSKARCSVAQPPSSNNTGSANDRTSRQYSGGNPVCPRETPKWQKPITNFFVTKDNPSNDTTEDIEIDDSKETAGTSKPKQRKNVIESDEEETEVSPQKNSELEESIILEPLNGDDSHKMDEYYQDTKGKDGGKKSQNKENVDGNTQRNSIKRDLEEVTFEEESQHASKKVKVV